jgi:hypothetical protein
LKESAPLPQLPLPLQPQPANPTACAIDRPPQPQPANIPACARDHPPQPQPVPRAESTELPGQHYSQRELPPTPAQRHSLLPGAQALISDDDLYLQADDNTC